jgi:hypothetical protein
MNHKEYTEAVERKEYPSDPMCPLGSKFENAAGEILNLIESCPVNSIAIIKSFAGSERSHHLHKTADHFLFILDGELEYYERTLDEDPDTIKPIIYKTNEMFYTPPLKLHLVRFLKDTTLISIGSNPRSKLDHESDLIRINFFDKNAKISI